MSTRKSTAILAIATFVASAAPAFAMSGLGCPELPLYYRAVGTIENGPSCGLTMEQARRILAHQNGPEDSPSYPTVYPHH